MTTPHSVLLPQGWVPPIGYSNGIAAERGRVVFVAGQVGWDAQQKFHAEALAPQFEQALKNVIEVLAVAGGRGTGADPGHDRRLVRVNDMARPPTIPEHSNQRNLLAKRRKPVQSALRSNPNPTGLMAYIEMLRHGPRHD